jgi:rod shape-determining protein MreC
VTVVDRTPPPFFKQGPSANLRLGVFALLAVALLVVDSRVGALGTLRQGLATLLYPVQRTLLVPRDASRLAGEYVGEVARLRAENAELKRLEATNARALLGAEQLAQENAQLRRLLGAREQSALPSVVGEVLYDTRDPFSRRIVIDKGAQHGVAGGQPVVDAQGLVGQVTRVFPLTAEVTLITDRQQSVPVQVARTGLRAVAYGGSGQGQVELRWLPLAIDVKEGDALVTSGLDGLYPAGLPVGKVVSVDRTTTFARVRVQPVAGVDRSRMLLVLLVEKSALPPPPPEPPLDPRKRSRREE